MKTTVTTHDPKEAKRILSSLDMALAIWDIRYNLMKRLERFSYNEKVTAEMLMERIRIELDDLLDDIDVDSMIE